MKTQIDMEKSYWVVFSGRTDLPILHVLKKGFRHCFVIIRDRGSWIIVDPLAHYMDVMMLDVPDDFDLPAWCENQGQIVVRARPEHAQRLAPVFFFTCVECVKRVLGIQRRRIMTPWQLYVYLHKSES